MTKSKEDGAGGNKRTLSLFYQSFALLSGKILIGVILTLSLMSLPTIAAEVSESNESTSQRVKYLPYPDIWDWQISTADRSSDPSATPIINIYAMDNGDIMVACEPDAGSPVVKYFTFFETSIVSDAAAKAVYKENYSGDAKSRIPYKADSFLTGGGSGTRSGGCYDALGFGIHIYDKTETRALEGKKLLYVFDHPKYYETNYPHCMDGPSFYYRVEAVDPKFFLLKDGTFLLTTHEGYVIRFEENFQTKSKLINNKFFWMDEKEFWAFEAKYGDRVDGDKDLKRLYADLYKLLMNKKRRAK